MLMTKLNAEVTTTILLFQSTLPNDYLMEHFNIGNMTNVADIKIILIRIKFVFLSIVSILLCSRQVAIRNDSCSIYV